MPLIEVLPNSTATATPGWAYVLDTGYDPSKAPIGASGQRKRKNAPVAAAAELSVRQQNKIAKHLDELDRDNHKAVQIELPSKSKDVTARGLRDRMTPGVKKILLSQKTFANHLSDEEAALALQQSDPAPTAVLRQQSSKMPKTPARRASRHSTSAPSATPDPKVIDSPAPARTPPRPPAPEVVRTITSPARTDTHPLLRSRIPNLPTEAELQALLAAPPLSYNAARVAPTTFTAPARQFCGMCGYWGRAKCLKCGVKYCGLECKAQHDESQCTRF